MLTDLCRSEGLTDWVPVSQVIGNIPVPAAPQPAHGAPAAYPAPADYGPEVAGALRAALERLPAQQREVVVMKLLHGLPFAEIAERVGSTEAACKMRFARGLESVRDEFAKRGLEP